VCQDIGQAVDIAIGIWVDLKYFQIGPILPEWRIKQENDAHIACYGSSDTQNVTRLLDPQEKEQARK